MDEKQRHRDDLSRSLENLRRTLGVQGAAQAERDRALAGAKSTLGPAAEVAFPIGATRAAREPASTINKGRRVLLFGGVATLLHLGLNRNASPARPGLLGELAQNVTHLSNRAHDSAQDSAIQLASTESRAAFSTDFSERDPLRHWWQLEADGLLVEPFETRMSAVPRGPSLAKPTRTMADGQAYFTFVQQRRDAGFILRGQDERDCYRVLYFPQTNGGKPEMVLSARRRRRGVEREIARRTITDLRLASMTRHHISVAMEGAQFAARLHWTESSRIPGWPPVNQDMVIATWRDETFRDGAVGVWGPEQRQTDGEFRLLTVATEA